MRNLYLIFAILGAIIPYIFFLNFFSNQGMDIAVFLKALFVNGAAGGFSADLLISSSAFWLYLWHQKAPRLWLYILINMTIGLSCALPLYLYLSYRQPQSNPANPANAGALG